MYPRLGLSFWGWMSIWLAWVRPTETQLFKISEWVSFLFRPSSPVTLCNRLSESCPPVFPLGRLHLRPVLYVTLRKGMGSQSPGVHRCLDTTGTSFPPSSQLVKRSRGSETRVPLQSPEFTDASLQGWGAVHGDHRCAEM